MRAGGLAFMVAVVWEGVGRWRGWRGGGRKSCMMLRREREEGC